MPCEQRAPAATRCSGQAAQRHGNRPPAATHSAVASTGMRSAGPSVRSPRPEQLTRQAVSGAGPQKQGGAHGPQPRPGAPASAPSHRPRPRASARRAGAPGSIVSAARAWPRRPEARLRAGGHSSGGAGGRHGGARGGIRWRPRPVHCATPAQRCEPGRGADALPRARAALRALRRLLLSWRGVGRG